MWWNTGSGDDEKLGEPPPIPPQNLEVKELRDQFEHQQAFIGHLKEMLRKNEEQLVDKEKEVQEYAQKLSNIKSRSTTLREVREKEKLIRSSLKSPEVLQVKDKSSKEGTSKSTPSEKFNLLKKQLEENRVKYEQRGKEITESKRGIEEMVEHLRSQLEEREHTIQELQEGFAAQAAKAQSRIQKTSKSVGTEPFVGESFDNQELHAQLAYKDNKIFELSNRVLELEAKVLDLQENVKEKDAVIDARTKAIALMSEDLSKKSKTTLDTLDETREQMRIMQSNFISVETRMNAEKEDLNRQLEVKNERLLQFEENIKTLECARFELSTRNAELQEKVVHLQEKLKRKTEELDSKAKSQNKKRRKFQAADNPEKQVPDNAEIVLLQQKIAELEEDKGNLQLHLVDFDDVKASEVIWRNKSKELEENIQLMQEQLSLKSETIVQLEQEKLTLLSGLSECKEKIFSLEEMIQELQNSMVELENIKVTAELKGVQLEEQLDFSIREKSDLLDELAVLKAYKEKVEKNATDIETEVARSHKEISVTVDPSGKQEKDSLNFDISRQPLSEGIESEGFVMKQESASLEVDTEVLPIDESNDKLNELIRQYEALASAAQESSESFDRCDIPAIMKDLSEMSSDLEEWKNRCSMVENRLALLEEEKHTLEKHLEDVMNENHIMSTQLRLQQNVSEDLAGKLRQNNAELSSRDEIIIKLKANLEESDDQMSGYLMQKQLLETELSEKASLCDETAQECQRYKTECLKLQSLVDELTEKEKCIKDEVDNLQQKLEVTTKRLQETEEELAIVNEHLKNSINDLSEKNCKLDITVQNLKETEQELIKLQLIHDDTLEQVSSKDKVVEELNENARSRNEKIKKLTASLKAKVVIIKDYEEKGKQYKISLEERDNRILELCAEIEKLQQKYEVDMDKLICELHEKNVEIDVIKENNTDQNDGSSTFSKELAESLKNEVTVLQLELCNKQKEIDSLSNQVVNFSAKAEDLKKYSGEIEQELKMLQEQYNIKALQQDETSSNISIQKYEERIEQLENEIPVLQMDLQQKQRENGDLRDQLQEALGELETKETLFKQREMEMQSFIQDQINLLAEKENLLISQQDDLNRLMELNELQDTSCKQKIKHLSSLVKDCELIISKIESERFHSRNIEGLLNEKLAHISSLEEQLSNNDKYLMTVSAMEMKLNERDAVIESLEQELTKAQERVEQLEGGLQHIEERRQSLQSKFEVIAKMLEESAREKEEVEIHEGMLEQRLASVLQSTEELKTKLKIESEGKFDLVNKMKCFEEENKHLNNRLLASENKVKKLEKDVEELFPLDAAYQQASKKVEDLENELKHARIEFEKCINEKDSKYKTYIETLELDLRNISREIEILGNEKRAMSEECEKLNDLKTSLEEESGNLNDLLNKANEKISELYQNISQKEEERCQLVSELDNFRSSSNYQTLLQTEIAQSKADSVQRENSEVSCLKEELSKKDLQIQNYQAELLKLQFGSDFSEPKQVNMQNEQIILLQDSISDKDRQIMELKVIIGEYERELKALQSLFSVTEEELNELREFHKNITIKSSQDDTISNSVEALRSQYESVNLDLVTQLAHAKAQFEVSRVITLAFLCVEDIRRHGSEYPRSDKHYKTCTSSTSTQTSIVAEHDEVYFKQTQQHESESSVKVGFGEKSSVCGINSPLKWEAESVPNFDEDGWGTDEARLEEEHMKKQSIVLKEEQHSSELIKNISELSEEIKELQSEKMRLLKELHISQVRFNKLLKKMKEVQSKNEALLKENQEFVIKFSKSKFGDLDFTIQEELKIRIDSLEKELKENISEKESVKMEKEALNKRIEVLTSANERFADLKEKQDQDMELLRQRNKELAKHIQILEQKVWELEEVCSQVGVETDNFAEADKISKQTSQKEEHTEDSMEELQSQLSALIKDNEELQSLLEEQRNMRVAAESQLIQLKSQSPNVSNALKTNEMKYEEISSTENDYDMLKYEYDFHLSECAEERDKLLMQIEESEKKINELHNEKLKLKMEFNTLLEENSNLRSGIEALSHNEMEIFSNIKADYEKRLQDLLNEKLKVEKYNKELSENHSSLVNRLEEVTIKDNETLDNIRADYEKQVHDLRIEKQEIDKNYNNALQDQNKAYFELEQIRTEITEYKKTIETLENDKLRFMEEVHTLKQLLSNERILWERRTHDLNQKLVELTSELNSRVNLNYEDDMFKAREIMKSQEKSLEELQQVVNEYEEKIKALCVELDDCKKMLAQREENYAYYALEEESHSNFSSSASQILASKENEIENLKNQLSKVNAELTENQVLRQRDLENMKMNIAHTEGEIESLLYLKDADIHSLRTQLAEQERITSENLAKKENYLINLQIQINEKDARLATISEELVNERSEVNNLKNIIEDLEDNINTMTKTLRDQDIEVEILKAKLQTRADKSTKETEVQSVVTDEKSELDLALYMLHQRDVRCDELTLELMQLLEERDTLQLRLSNALRLNEQLRNKTSTSSAGTSPIKSRLSSVTEGPRSSSFQPIDVPVDSQAVKPQSTDEPKEDLKALATKISLLHSSDYRQDVTLKDERELRHSEQIRMLQQRGRNVVDATYTLSRDVQSSSTVLMNWIWGRSTPKVMHL